MLFGGSKLSIADGFTFETAKFMADQLECFFDVVGPHRAVNSHHAGIRMGGQEGID